MIAYRTVFLVFFFNDTATTEIYTLSLHDALPISAGPVRCKTIRSSQHSTRIITKRFQPKNSRLPRLFFSNWTKTRRSEEHTSELQSRLHLVCRLLLEKKKKQPRQTSHPGQSRMTG